MGRREQSHAPRSRLRRSLRWLPELLVVVLVGLALVDVQYDVGHRWLGIGPDARKDPAAVLPPEGLDLPEQRTAADVAPPVEVDAADRVAVAAALQRHLGDPDLGPRRAFAVADLRTGAELFRRGVARFTPASTLKVLTSVAALDVLGPGTTFSTRVQRKGNQVFLVGGGDPLLARTPKEAKGEYPPRADLTTLARRTAKALQEEQVRRVRLVYDDSLFTGPAVNPAWPDSYLPENVVPPITALWADEGHAPSWGFVEDPSATAAQLFADALRRNGIQVAGPPGHRKAPPDAVEVATVQSATVGQLVEHTIALSDNQAAEVLARHVGLAVLGDGSFAGGARAVRQTLTGLGVPMAGTRLYDGSGLSRQNLLTADALLSALRLAASEEHPELRKVITGLPVAGYTGSLRWRFDEAPLRAKGMVRAKTGTLTGVHGLAGVVTDRSGAEMAFVAIADRVPVAKTLDAREAIDDLAAALGACLCGS